MSSPISRGFLLLGFLCLWVIPTEEKLSIKQQPNPAVVGADVILTLEEVNQNDVKAVAWYQSKQVDASKLISGRVMGENSIMTGSIDIAKDGAIIVTTNNALKIPNFKNSYVNGYTAQVITANTVETATIIVTSSSNLCAMSSSILLLAAVLFSSLRLL